ncbi:hypothetical protein RclHR1_06470005 [Rhizophagus clarus]|uniref:Uncharacterized protein n=1 Tax=Rhizophagus clarus TaxID=94130 RepID=A0A2Z6S9Z7_9GLOM|nr:hypothetical protein RclHR1_06470005 [Rhizophagus clarus]
MTITNSSISTAKTANPDITIRNLTIGNINLGGSSLGSSKVQGTTQVKFKSPVKKSIPTTIPLSGGNFHNITTSNVSSQNTQPAYPIIQLAPTDNADLLTQLLQEFNQILSANQHHSSPTSNIRKESRLVDFPKFKGGNQDPIEWLEAFDRALSVQSTMLQIVKEAINKAKATETAFSMGTDLSAYSLTPGYLPNLYGAAIPAQVAHVAFVLQNLSIPSVATDSIEEIIERKLKE